MTIKPERIRCIKEGHFNHGPIVYWMSRDQRIQDNWALLFAQETALHNKVPLMIVFCLAPDFLNAGLRHYDFMLKGLEKVAAEANKYNIPFSLLTGKPEEEIPRLITAEKAGTLITDFDPLRIKTAWKKAVAQVIDIPFYEVDAHNIVPCWVTSGKQEYGASTIRGKIHKNLHTYMEEFPEIRKHPFNYDKSPARIKWNKMKSYPTDVTNVPPITWLLSGENHAHETLTIFIEKNLDNYARFSNDPNAFVLSNLSPYLHFGQISAQRVALDVSLYSLSKKINAESFLEQLIVRRELADNYCFYCKNYDRFDGFPQWAKNTLNEHRDDSREYIYSLEEFEEAKTHDLLWNAAQQEMISRGKMHSYMRMYWAKKILEWSICPEEAIKIAVYLNDKYELDGRDPNGYVGIMWSIGGLHDRAWSERLIFGKIRYMNFKGCKRKFDVQKYIKRFGTSVMSILT